MEISVCNERTSIRDRFKSLFSGDLITVSVINDWVTYLHAILGIREGLGFIAGVDTLRAERQSSVRTSNGGAGPKP